MPGIEYNETLNFLYLAKRYNVPKSDLLDFLKSTADDEHLDRMARAEAKFWLAKCKLESGECDIAASLLLSAAELLPNLDVTAEQITTANFSATTEDESAVVKTGLTGEVISQLFLTIGPDGPAIMPTLAARLQRLITERCFWESLDDDGYSDQYGSIKVERQLFGNTTTELRLLALTHTELKLPVSLVIKTIKRIDVPESAFVAYSPFTPTPVENKPPLKPRQQKLVQAAHELNREIEVYHAVYQHAAEKGLATVVPEVVLDDTSNRMNPVLVMEDAGVDLDTFYRNHCGQRPDLELLSKLFHLVVSAISVIHQSGYVHGDLKPANMLFTKHANGEMSVKIIDFGSARKIGQEHYQDLQTPEYSAPELYGGEPVLATSAIDVASIGLIFRQLWKGLPHPFSDGDHYSTSDLRHCTAYFSGKDDDTVFDAEERGGMTRSVTSDANSTRVELDLSFEPEMNAHDQSGSIVSLPNQLSPFTQDWLSKDTRVDKNSFEKTLLAMIQPTPAARPSVEQILRGMLLSPMSTFIACHTQPRDELNLDGDDLARASCTAARRRSSASSSTGSPRSGQDSTLLGLGSPLSDGLVISRADLLAQRRRSSTATQVAELAASSSRRTSQPTCDDDQQPMDPSLSDGVSHLGGRLQAAKRFSLDNAEAPSLARSGGVDSVLALSPIGRHFSCSSADDRHSISTLEVSRRRLTIAATTALDTSGTHDMCGQTLSSCLVFSDADESSDDDIGLLPKPTLTLHQASKPVRKPKPKPMSIRK